MARCLISYAPISHGAQNRRVIHHIELKPFCHLDHKVIFGHIRGKQESCEKHISDCKTEVECEARNMKTLRSGGNLFIKYPSVAHSLPSNKQQALICV